MAKAFIEIKQSFNMQSESELAFYLSISYYGLDVDNDATVAGPHEVATTPISASASAVQLENAIANFVIDHAANLSLTVGNGDILICGLKFI